MKTIRLILSLTIIFLGLTFAGQSYAATFTVTKTADTNDGICDADCSLREAVAAANVSSDNDVINFEPAVFSSPQTITLTNGQINFTISESVTINGTGANLLTISGNNQSRIFFSNFSSSSITINNLTLTQGFATNGGAIYASAALILTNIIVTGNTAAGAEASPAGHAAGLGGGIYSTGGLKLINSTVSNNLASGVLVPNPNSGDSGSAGGGGGVFSYGTGNFIINCTFANNMAKGISSPNTPTSTTGNPPQGGAAHGGAMYGIFSFTIINSSFTNNSAVAGNGGTIITFALTGNGGEAFGGAVYSSGSRFLNSTFSGNSAVSGNGGNTSGDGGNAYGGGVVDNDLKMTNSTVVNNTLSSGNGRNGGNSRGGGIYGGSNQWSIINSTVTGNTVTAGTGTQTNGLNQGGGVFSNPDTGQASSFRNNIIAENTAAAGSDVFGNYINAANNLIRTGEGSTGIVNGVNGNLVGTSGSPVNPMLAALADNGGSTRTRALLAGSPAINAGNNSFAINPVNGQTLQFDQRGWQRIIPAGGVIDMGAFEFGATTIQAAASPDLQSASDTGTSNTDNITKATLVVFDILNVIPGAKVELLRNNTVVSSVEAMLFSVSLTDSNPPLNGVVQYTSRQTFAGVVSEVSAPLSVTFDNTPPSVVINQAATQADPTAVLPIRFTAVFSEPVTGINQNNILVNGVAPNTIGAFITVTGSGTTYTIEVRGMTATGQIAVTLVTPAAFDFAFNPATAATSTDNRVTYILKSTLFDFDGDKKTDISIYRPSVGEWWYLRSFNNQNRAFQFGSGSDKIMPADYTGDGRTDAAFFRPSTGEWFILRSEDGSYYSFAFGTTGDIPVVGDFDADNKADAGVFRPSTATWYISKSTGGTLIQQFGANGDTPVVSDYDADGKADIAIYRAAAGEWWIQRSSNNSVLAFQFGSATDKPLPADFTGDLRADAAFFRPSTGEWFVLRSEDFSYYSFPFGISTDIPAPGDYDGDGKADAAVFRPADSVWYIQRSTAGILIRGFGQSGDTPVPNAFVP